VLHPAGSTQRLTRPNSWALERPIFGREGKEVKREEKERREAAEKGKGGSEGTGVWCLGGD